MNHTRNVHGCFVLQHQLQHINFATACVCGVFRMQRAIQLDGMITTHFIRPNFAHTTRCQGVHFSEIIRSNYKHECEDGCTTAIRAHKNRKTDRQNAHKNRQNEVIPQNENASKIDGEPRRVRLTQLQNTKATGSHVPQIRSVPSEQVSSHTMFFPRRMSTAMLSSDRLLTHSQSETSGTTGASVAAEVSAAGMSVSGNISNGAVVGAGITIEGAGVSMGNMEPSKPSDGEGVGLSDMSNMDM